VENPRILVASVKGLDIGDAPIVILGITDATWADLAGDKAQDIDLRKIGIPAKVLVMRGVDQDDIVRQLREATAGVEMPEGGLADLSIPDPTRN
jgi:hypothetical protein